MAKSFLELLYLGAHLFMGNVKVAQQHDAIRDIDLHFNRVELDVVVFHIDFAEF